MDIFDRNNDKRFGHDDRFGGDIQARDTTPVYRPPSYLDIPEEIKLFFNDKGYGTKWVRMYIGGAIDAKNLRTKMSPAEGYTFVAPDELSPSQLILLGEPKTGTPYGDLIVSGDSVLMKTPLEKVAARKKYIAETTRRRSEADMQRIKENNLQHSDRSTTRTGKRAHFSPNNN